MPLIRALIDLRIKSMAVPLNRVAHVDDSTSEVYITSGRATDDEKHIEQGLLMNPEVIDIAGGYVASVQAGSDSLDFQQVEQVEQFEQVEKTSPSKK